MVRQGGVTRAEPGRRWLLRALCGLIVVFKAVLSAYAQTDLVKTWNNGDWIVPAAGGKVLHGANSPNADFAIAQWGNPSALTGFHVTGCAPGRTNCFVASSPNITDSLYTDLRGNHWIDLLSLGTGIPCRPGAGYELGNFQTAIGPVYRSHPQAVLASASLGRISHLVLALTAEPINFATLQGAQCAPKATGAGMLVGLVLNNPKAHQTLFYQLRLQSYRSPAGPGFFANVQPFGYRDIIGEFGTYTSGLPVGKPTTLSIDVLPRLKTILSTARNGLDTNVADWTTGSAYVGQNVFGNVRAETAWCCFSLTAR